MLRKTAFRQAAVSIRRDNISLKRRFLGTVRSSGVTFSGSDSYTWDWLNLFCNRSIRRKPELRGFHLQASGRTHLFPRRVAEPIRRPQLPAGRVQGWRRSELPLASDSVENSTARAIPMARLAPDEKVPKGRTGVSTKRFWRQQLGALAGRSGTGSPCITYPPTPVGSIRPKSKSDFSPGNASAAGEFRTSRLCAKRSPPGTGT